MRLTLKDIQITHHTTNCVTIRIGKTKAYFSYETLVAFKHGDLEIVRYNEFSKTTTKHMSLMGVNKFEVKPYEEFKAIVEEVINGRG